MSAKQLFIIGAGASNGAACAHEKYKPPLTSDLPNIFNHHFISISHTEDGKYIPQWFAELLEITGTKKDIEEFFTIFFSLEVISSKINPGFVFLSFAQIQDLQSKFSILEQYFQKKELVIIRKIFDFFFYEIPKRLSSYVRKIWKHFLEPRYMIISGFLSLIVIANITHCYSQI